MLTQILIKKLDRNYINYFKKKLKFYHKGLEKIFSYTCSTKYMLKVLLVFSSKRYIWNK